MEDGAGDVNHRDYTLDAHHIIERKLWQDGGYYLDNGATLCSKHHREAENSSLSCRLIREAAGIKTIMVPDGYDVLIDKWGDLPQVANEFTGES